MNLIHRWLCGSARWKKVVETYILPWTLEGLNLGSTSWRSQPGGAPPTDLLHTRVARLDLCRGGPQVCGEASPSSRPECLRDV